MKKEKKLFYLSQIIHKIDFEPKRTDLYAYGILDKLSYFEYRVQLLQLELFTSSKQKL